MPSDFTLSIPPDLDGAALGSALKRLLPHLSWSQIKALIERRHVEVNGTLALEEGRRVKAGDVVEVFERPRAAPPGERDVDVLHMDEHLVVVDKPAGIVTQRHPAERDWDPQRKARQPSLEEIVQRLLDQRWRERLAKMRAFGSQPGAKGGVGKSPRGKHPLARGSRVRSRGAPPPKKQFDPAVRTPKVRAVHRLDRDTSGLMVFAISREAEEALVRLFKKHAIERTYLAVVHGHPAGQTIESWFVRDRGDGLRGSSASAVGSEHAERAVTHVKPVERIGNYSLIECRLETGRTHQIRIHLAEIGHPLCGERVYTHKLGEPPRVDGSGAPRQALHSSELRFVHPITGNRTQFRSALPGDLSKWLERMRSETAR
jgi:23S rRNA pseudouridine1911/1915/1917 synthase